MVWPLGKKRKVEKNQTKTFVDGKQVEGVPDKVPELKVPQPPQMTEEERAKADFIAGYQAGEKDAYEEGRTVGLQEGMIYSLNTLNAELVRIQTELKKQAEQQQEVKP